MADQYLYVTVFSIDGVEHTISGHSDTAKEVEKSFRLIAGHRKLRAPEEEMKLLRIHFRVTPDEQAKIVAESSAKNPDLATTDPMLLHKPQSEVIDFEKQA